MSVGSDTDGDRTFSQEEVEQIVQGRVAKLKGELEKSKDVASDLDKSKAAMTALENELKVLKTVTPPPEIIPHPSEDDVKGQIKLMQSQYKKEIEALRNQVEQEKSARDQERGKRMNVEREREITTALQAAGCRNDALDMGLRYFEPQIEFDEDEQKNFYRLKSGGTVSITDGIAEELPDYLKASSMQAGGSGSQTSSKGAVRQKELESANTKLAELQKTATLGGRNDDILAYQKQKRIVTDLETEAAAS